MLAGAVNLLNPEIVIVWGYLADAEHQLFAGMSESISQYAAPGSGRSVRIERAALGDDAGIFGAAMLVVENGLAPSAVDAHLLAHLTSRRA